MTPITAAETPPEPPAPAALAGTALATLAMFTGIVAVTACPGTDADTEILNVLVAVAVTAPVEATPAAFVVTMVDTAPFANAADPPLSCVSENITAMPATGLSLESVTRITDSELIMFCLRRVGFPAADRISIRYF
jgi:hypothetical protein